MMAFVRALIVFMLANVAISDAGNSCLLMSSIGYTVPAGDIEIELGTKPLEIFCTVDDKRFLSQHSNPSKDLAFMVRGIASEKYTKIVNSTTIRLFIEANELFISKLHVQCIWNSTKDHVTGLRSVCNNFVIVGVKPTEITDFGCVSLNNDNLTCTWSNPNYGFNTKFELNYTVLGVTQRCPQIAYDDATKKLKCFWSLSTKPGYRQSAEYFTFTLNSANSVGTYSQKVDFDHYANVIPNAPENLSVINSTTNSIYLRWKIPSTIISLHHGLRYRVLYICSLGMKTLRQAAMEEISGEKEVYFNLTGIPFAHNLCDIRVALRANKAVGEAMWSRNAIIDAYYTSSTVPGIGPKLNMGSFWYINYNSVRIYWKKVPKELENGANLKYNVTLVNGGGDVVKIGEIQSNSAVIRNLNDTKNYTFAVWAYNDEGENRERAYITIPPRTIRPFPVPSLTKVVESNENSIDISWTPSPTRALIKYYTLFWCTDSQSNRESCNGDWDWTNVPSTELNFKRKFEFEYNQNKSMHYHVAISANTEHFSSGMTFSTCDKTTGGETEGSVPMVVLSQPVDILSRSIRLKWFVGCAKEDIEKFEIHYCLCNKEGVCVNNPKIQEVNGTESSFPMGPLIPYKSYRFEIVAIKDSNNRGTLSAPVFTTTSEDKPGSPTNLTASHITNSSMVITWVAPLITNGIIKYTRITYNGADKQTNSSDETTFTMENLLSYRTYEVNVSACTTKCSDPITITPKTLMGSPNQITAPTASSTLNDSVIPIVWNAPTEPHGPLSFYELRVDSDGIVKYYTVPGNDRRYTIDCDKKTSSYKIWVRAYNQDTENNKNYTGEWSERFDGNCSPKTPWLIPILILLVLLFTILAVFGKKLYARCRRMQDVEVKLPSDLVNPNWPIPKEVIDRESKKPAADEELLLKTRNNESSKQQCDSSGCSSGHGSVVSDTDATISAASDSGTDQTELRKRSRTSSKTSLVAHMDTIIAKNATDYSRVGMETNPLANADDITTGYTRMPSAFEQRNEAPAVVMAIEPNNFAYVSYEAAMGRPAVPKEEPFSKPYVQIADANLIKNVQDINRAENLDSRLSYVSVGQVPNTNNMKSIKED